MLKSLNIFDFDSCDSTNLKAREYVLLGGALPALFTAREQTAGRGRRGKSFYSPKDTGIYLTLALPWDKALQNSVALTTTVSVGAVRALSKYTDKTLSIKWVNDIFADGKKTAGILCETVALPNSGDIKAVIIGIGVNLTTNNFPDDITQEVTCLSCDVSNRKDIIKDLTKDLFDVIYSENEDRIIEEYRKLSAVIGKEIYYIKDGKTYDANVLGIDRCGGLMIVHPDGTLLTLTSGEITLRIK